MYICPALWAMRSRRPAEDTICSIADLKEASDCTSSSTVRRFHFVLPGLTQHMPPLARIVCPLIQPPSGPTRKETTRAMSSV
jgi:hypothetical protein